MVWSSLKNDLGLMRLRSDRVRRMASSTVEDYIKHIYLVSEKTRKDQVSMGHVAEALGVVPLELVEGLADPGKKAPDEVLVGGVYKLWYFPALSTKYCVPAYLPSFKDRIS